ncbi:hypothetical protein L6164_036798 [Bauhinia variegata]|uniref:Uncharacterized protein n=1 Tax=Bauhinia variegata TaxID=167791 RepID=A0ACB9KI54_BAUVA|nr:hypothetical protein L6164_036798 [Bauhinia variegata]
MYQLSKARTKGISFGCQKVGDRESSCSIDTESGSESVNDSIPDIRERMTKAPILLDGKDDVKSSSNSREGIVSNGMESGSKLAGNMQSLHKEVKKSKPILLENSMPTKDVNILSSQLNPSSKSEKTVRHSIQMSVSPQADMSGQESLQKLKLGSVEGNKLASVSSGKITPVLSSLKISRNSKECSEEIVEQVESRPNNLVGHDPISRLESPLQKNLTEVGILHSILLEDNSNVEKAEAYAKELENVSNLKQTIFITAVICKRSGIGKKII